MKTPKTSSMASKLALNRASQVSGERAVVVSTQTRDRGQKKSSPFGQTGCKHCGQIFRRPAEKGLILASEVSMDWAWVGGRLGSSLRASASCVVKTTTWKHDNGPTEKRSMDSLERAPERMGPGRRQGAGRQGPNVLGFDLALTRAWVRVCTIHDLDCRSSRISSSRTPLPEFAPRP